ncbi:hypothetical protein SLEP1_g27027 [Rubroshorea leprosula]|uniref:Uncharacterized protein n=1 Tax=Rubroshorea leprosula TaxID=152421 RepID=A0AAV5JZU5_9ROSI|nr:hypothetical protein SLEP1_g27027 [Rubroshorea leprosula]
MAGARKDLMYWCLRAISGGCTSITSPDQCYQELEGVDVLVFGAISGGCTSIKSLRSMLCKFSVFDLRPPIPSKFFWFLCSSASFLFEDTFWSPTR